jgi:hypothetical protein
MKVSQVAGKCQVNYETKRSEKCCATVLSFATVSLVPENSEINMEWIKWYRQLQLAIA